MIEKWWLEAKCLTLFADLSLSRDAQVKSRVDRFYPHHGTGSGMIKKCCQHCSVRVECLDDAMATEVPFYDDELGINSKPMRFGIWGGMTPSQRQKLYESRQVGNSSAK